MGFSTSRGLGRRMRLQETDTRISPERLADMEKFLRMNGIEVSDSVLDFDEVYKEIFFFCTANRSRIIQLNFHV